jgi:hypothetical protein
VELPKVEGPYLSREERLDLRYATPQDDPATVRVSTLVIKTVEKDVRALLDHLENEYTNNDLRQAMQRLRKWVGYK